ncbi:SNF2 family N-terminal domain-containing protein [Pisolithus tinctorius]|nr:SNF2 family N-terminal domain-containing protein [Pisolithus tinctorius]
MVQTRRRARASATPATTATTATSTSVSPSMTDQLSVEPETPLTSDVELLEVPQKLLAKTSAMNRNTRKRVADTEIEEIEVIATKRRVVSKAVFVEIPVVSSKDKGKGKALEPPQTEHDNHPFCASEDEPELIQVSESESSGSEFELSDIDDISVNGHGENDYVPSSDEDEAQMMSVAIQLSRETARVEAERDTSGAGPSSRPAPKRAPQGAYNRRRSSFKRPATRRNRRSRSYADSEEDEIDSESELGMELLNQNDTESAPSESKGDDDGLGDESVVYTSIEEEFRVTMRKFGRKLTLAERSRIRFLFHHPELRNVWRNLKGVAVAAPEKAPQPAGLKVTLLPFQQESLSWMRKQEESVWKGGILADEMGMGKTIQMISLFVSDLKRPNLVIAPTVALIQWRNEIQAHTENMNVLVWHGSSRSVNHEELKKYDVVLTTYAIAESCFRKQHSGFKRKGLIIKEKSPLHQINWNRVILDEAHNIKERATNTAKACFELQSNYKWCLSGTPLQNRVGELYSLVRFLGGDPFSYYFCRRCDCQSLHWNFSDKKTCDECGHGAGSHTCFWNQEILTPIQKYGMVGPGQVAFRKLRILLDRLMLRRTKIQRADDLGLPPRTVIVRRDYFSPEEKELYLSLFTDAKRQFNTYVHSGTVLNNYSNIFSLITRMRQMACHPDLVLRSKKNGYQFFNTEELGEGTVCRLCNDFAEDAIQAKCRHIFDRECIKQYLSASCDVSPDCPVCHLPLTIDLEAPALELGESAPVARQGILGRLDLDTWQSSSKIEALIEELSNLRLQDATTKSIVFSQFVNFLDLIAYRLQKAGFQICRLEGGMSPRARDATIQHFMNNVEVTVFLVSLKAGGVALNLTEASRVYLMDSWWNPAVEYQAMDRIHRLGQHRPVQAIKLVIEDSIESRIVQLQEKKSAMVDATLSTDESAMGRLTPEDLSFLFRL